MFLTSILTLVLRQMLRAGVRLAARVDQEDLQRLRTEFSEVIDRELRDMA